MVHLHLSPISHYNCALLHKTKMNKIDAKSASEIERVSEPAAKSGPKCQHFFYKNHDEPRKVAKLAKYSPI